MVQKINHYSPGLIGEFKVKRKKPLVLAGAGRSAEIWPLGTQYRPPNDKDNDLIPAQIENFNGENVSTVKFTPLSPNPIEIIESVERRKIEMQALKQSDASKQDVEGPKPLQRDIGDPASYPVDVLPEVIKGAIESINASIQAPLAMCAQSVLAASALAVQGHADIVVDGRVYPISENFITIGQSGERKSAVDHYALFQHSERQKELKQDHDKQYDEYNLLHSAWKKSHEEALKKGNTYENRQALLRELGPEPQPPTGYVLKTDEGTFQGLCNLLRDGQPSIGLFSDEGGRLLGGYSMSSDNRLQTIAGLSNFWDGRPIARSTGGSGTLVISGRRVSFHMMVQPRVAKNLLCDESAEDQGFLSRCLTVFPNTAIGTRHYQPMDLFSDDSMSRYWAVIKRILNRPLPIKEGTRNELDPPKIALSTDSKEKWIMFHNAIEEQMKEGGALENIRDFGSKIPEHALRLAGIVTLTSDIDAKEIDVDAMTTGIELAKFYLQETIRIRNGLNPNTDLGLAQKVLDFMHKKWTPANGKYIDLVSLYQCGPTGVRTAERAREIIHVLTEHEWLTKCNHPKSVCGKMRKEVWEIHNG